MVIGRNPRLGNMPTPERDRYYNAAEIARFITQHWRKVDRSSVRRWMTQGRRGIRLRSIRPAGQLLAKWRWVEEFWTANCRDAIGDALNIPGMEQARAQAAGEGLDRLMGRSNN